jgi:tRNA(fMet)-specific endonuclease VapC
VERLILDTGALIALERGDIDSDQLGDDDADVAISAIAAAELLAGVELANDQHRDSRSTLVEGVLARVEIVAFDLTIARHHAALLAHVRRVGRPRGAHDLQIAATARATRRTILTTDVDAFNGLPGVSYRVIPAR